MNEHERILFRVASRVHGALNKHAHARWSTLEDHIRRTRHSLEALAQLEQRLAICRRHGWHEAAKSVVLRREYSLYDLSPQLEHLKQAMNQTAAPLAGVGEVYQELLQTETEFGEVQYNADDRCITVTTDPIVLEGVYLGPFEIRILLDHLDRRSIDHALRIVALEPNRAATNDTVTHPHVSDDRLCTGDASTSLQTSLSAGRLCDFFLLVRSVLTHYNPESPYVALDRWDGRPCHECGYVTDDDHSCYCEACEHDFCDECVSCCRACHSTQCRSCLGACEVCDSLYCDNCLKHCKTCDHATCSRCLQPCTACSSQICPDCRCEGICTSCQESEEDHHEDGKSKPGKRRQPARSAQAQAGEAAA